MGGQCATGPSEASINSKCTPAEFRRFGERWVALHRPRVGFVNAPTYDEHLSAPEAWREYSQAEGGPPASKTAGSFRPTTRPDSGSPTRQTSPGFEPYKSPCRS
jgi:hypothetical protein